MHPPQSVFQKINITYMKATEPTKQAMMTIANKMQCNVFTNFFL